MENNKSNVFISVRFEANNISESIRMYRLSNKEVI